MNMNLNAIDFVDNNYHELKNNQMDSSFPLCLANNYNQYNSRNICADNSLSSNRSVLSDATTTTLSGESYPITEYDHNLKLKYLEEELNNARADKEFVWSLWKQLQSTNPDLTTAISLVVKREKEKAEIKDNKVIEILNLKDKEIDRLNKINNDQTLEFNSHLDRLRIFETNNLKQEEIIDNLKLSLKTLNDKEQMYQQMIRLRDNKHEELLKDFESNNNLLTRIQHMVDDKNKEIDKLKDVQINLKNENDHLKKTNDVLKGEVIQRKENYEKLLLEFDKFRSSTDNTVRTEINRLQSEITSKEESLEKIKKYSNELASKLNSKTDFINEQENIIKKLRQIQIDLINANKAEKEASGILQNENHSLREMYEQINMKYKECLDNEKKIIKENIAIKENYKQAQSLILDKFSLRENNQTQLYENEERFNDSFEPLSHSTRKMKFGHDANTEALRCNQNVCKLIFILIISCSL
jgi:centlein